MRSIACHRPEFPSNSQCRCTAGYFTGADMGRADASIYIKSIERETHPESAHTPSLMNRQILRFLRVLRFVLCIDAHARAHMHKFAAYEPGMCRNRQILRFAEEPGMDRLHGARVNLELSSCLTWRGTAVRRHAHLRGGQEAPVGS